MRDGCYLINYTPAGADLVSYDGTLRVHTEQGRVSASADLYQREVDGTPELGPAPDPAAGFPIFSMANYRYYFRVTQVAQTAAGVSLAFEALRFSTAKVALLDGRETHFPKEASPHGVRGARG